MERAYIQFSELQKLVWCFYFEVKRRSRKLLQTGSSFVLYTSADEITTVLV